MLLIYILPSTILKVLCIWYILMAIKFQIYLVKSILKIKTLKCPDWTFCLLLSAVRLLEKVKNLMYFSTELDFFTILWFQNHLLSLWAILDQAGSAIRIAKGIVKLWWPWTWSPGLVLDLSRCSSVSFLVSDNLDSSCWAERGKCITLICGVMKLIQPPTPTSTNNGIFHSPG
jgi:hypothetical protein